MENLSFKYTIRLFFIILFIINTSLLSAQQLDTTRTYELNEIVIDHRSRTERASSPLQEMNVSKLNNLPVLQLSDAVKHFAGVTIKDFGGVGGLKTISVRSLGSAHTAVAIDGVPVNDVQTGQIDLGRYSLQNVGNISLVNGQSDDIFQPAKLLASASLLNIRSLPPLLSRQKKYAFNLTGRFGSFRFFNPSLSFSHTAGKKTILSLNSDWMQSKGNYPFTYYDGNQKIKEKRTNSDVKKLRMELSSYTSFSNTQHLDGKLYYYQTEQGLPGAVIIGNPNSSSERIKDKVFFAQANYRNLISYRWNFQANGKYNYSHSYYVNPAENIQNNYTQHEHYLSSVLQYFPIKDVDKTLSVSLANDGFINTLDSDQRNFAYPRRYSLLSALSARFVSQSVTATASLLSTITSETVKTGQSAENHNRLSPFVSLSYKPFKSENLRIRFFYKNIFRLPGFNDLYYTSIGNVNLLPESTEQFNAGLTYMRNMYGRISYVSFSSDVYFNKVTNKIIAVPKKSVFIWSMENIGEVEIKGLDLTFETRIKYTKNRGIILQGNYTYQEAIDVTDNTTESGRKTYGHQIAYTPRFSGSGNCLVETAWFDVGYSVLFSGRRYSAGQNIATNRLSGYTDMGISISRKFRYKDYSFSINAELLNLLNKNYQVVKDYPMSGRSFRLSFSVGY